MTTTARPSSRDDDKRLASVIDGLHGSLRDLALLQDLHRVLLSRGHPSSVRRQIAQSVWQYAICPTQHGVLAHASHPQAQDTDSILTCLQFHGLSSARLEIDHMTVSAGLDCPLVLVRGVVRGRYAMPQIEAMYAHTPGNSTLLNRLIDRDVTFPTTARFFFADDGTLERIVVDTDVAAQVLSITGTLSSTTRILHDLARTESLPHATKVRGKARRGSSSSTGSNGSTSVANQVRVGSE